MAKATKVGAVGFEVVDRTFQISGLRRALEEAGVTQSALAEAAGVSAAFAWRLVSTEGVRIRGAMAERIMAALEKLGVAVTLTDDGVPGF